MKRLSRNQIRVALLSLAALAVLIGGCVSRYRMDLFMGHDENRRKVDIEETAYAPDTRLADPMAEQKLMRGISSTITISVGTRGAATGGKDLVLNFDEYLKYRIYIELPSPPKAGSIDLAGHSFVQMLKRYELPPEQKIYLPVSGSFVIDSVKESNLFATLQGGVWENNVDSTVAFDGRLKLKIK